MGMRLQGWLPRMATSAQEASLSPAELLQAHCPASGGPWELGQRQANHSLPEGPGTCPPTHLPSGGREPETGSRVPGPGLMTEPEETEGSGCLGQLGWSRGLRAAVSLPWPLLPQLSEDLRVISKFPASADGSSPNQPHDKGGISSSTDELQGKKREMERIL